MLKISPVFPLFLLLAATLFLEAFILERTFYLHSDKMTWAEARQYCQKNYIDLIAADAEDTSWLSAQVRTLKEDQVWIGLLRDPEDDFVWRWIDLKTGEGISGDNVSGSSSWATGQQSHHCAYADDKKWHSAKCSHKEEVFCSNNDQIQHHSNKLNWYKASQYCQNISNGLAIVSEENKDLLRSKTGWIGLYRKGGDTWSWISDSRSTYRNWAEQEPRTSDCAIFDVASEKFHSEWCSSEIPFVCSADNLVLVKENKTWEEALNHCKSIHTPCDDSSEESCVYQHSLLSLTNFTSEDYSYVRNRINKATSNEVWTGLRFLGGTWWWMNGDVVESQGELPDCPSQWKHCGTLSKSDENMFITRDCSERRNFICIRYKVKANQTDEAETSSG